MEMMHWDAGVKNVVVGGRPSYGPMQTPSGSRGARYYDFSELDADINNTITVEAQSGLGIDADLPDRTDQDLYILDGGITLRNQMREGESVPLQMQFEAADCRIFYTPLTFNNFTNLWKYAAEAIWTHPDLCVQGSTGFAKSKSTATTPNAAPLATPLAAVNYSSIGMPTLHHSDADISFLVSDQPLPDPGGPAFATRAQGPESNLRQINLYRLKEEQKAERIREAQRGARQGLPNGRVNHNSGPPSNHRRARRSARSSGAGSQGRKRMASRRRRST